VNARVIAACCCCDHLLNRELLLVCATTELEPILDRLGSELHVRQSEAPANDPAIPEELLVSTLRHSSKNCTLKTGQYSG